MEKFTKLTSVAAPVRMANIDTDKIIPARYLKTIKRTGLSEGLFHDMRHDGEGNKTDFVLNHPTYSEAQILVVGDNFGCGSSREHAPWALLDAGIRCLISTSFADIFHNNCFKNGVLPIQVSQEEHDRLMEHAERGANATLTVDLETQTIHGSDDGPIAFEVDAWKKHCLLNGLDDIGHTLSQDHKIDAFEERRRLETPWL